jgi:DNA adenine methylase
LTTVSKGVVNVSQVPNYSPLRYPGGKTWMIPRLRAWLASRSRPAVFLEPFAGGASLGCTVLMEDLADQVVLVELDLRVATFWQVLFGDQGLELADRMLSTDLLTELVPILAGDPTEPLELAWRTLVHNRVSHGGVLAPGGGVMKTGEQGRGVLSRWYPKTLHDRIVALHQKRDRVTVIHGDGLATMARYLGREDVSAFIDPPYTAGGKGAGKRLYLHHQLDHPELFRLTAGLRDAVMTYGPSQEVQNLAQQYGLEALPIAMKSGRDNRKTDK